MVDFKVIFNGPDGNTRLDLTQSVQDKDVTAQKVLINIPTIKGTDFLYPEKGTNLLKQCIGSVIIDSNTAQHIGNFAALDTIYFINDTDGLTIDCPYGLADVDLQLKNYDAGLNVLHYFSVVTFPDGTSTPQSNLLKFYMS